MANAVFTSSVTYEPGGGGSITQGFRTDFKYKAVSAGKWDVAAGAPPAKYEIPFGGVGSALGFILQNNTDRDVAVTLNGPDDAAGSPAPSQYDLAPGGMLMHWAAKAPASTAAAFKRVRFELKTAASVDGSVDFIILGD